MCGIVGYVGNEPCADLIVDGLRRLEYRGYDSAGIAVTEGGSLVVRRAEGKLQNLTKKLAGLDLHGTTGVGHTRWATHGVPSEGNAHPHVSGDVAVVHNGIIENYLELKRELKGLGYTFVSDTDTEVVAHLVNHYRSLDLDLAESVRKTTARLHGAYALVIVDAREPGTLVAVRLASPLVVGLGQHAAFVASDVSAILSHTRTIHFLEEGHLAILSSGGRVHFEEVASARPVEPSWQNITWTPAMAEKGGHKHFMLKEIHEQPRAVADTLRGRISLERATVELPEVGVTAEDLKRLSQLYIVACGTSWHAGLVGRYLIEDLAGLAPHVELASEFRYRNAPIDQNTLVLAISQSGETADTLAAIREAKRKGARVLSICNVIGSSIARESTAGVLYTHAGPEIGVASTKAFTTQLVALHLLALRFGELRGTVSEATRRAELEALLHAPTVLEKALRHSEDGAEPYRAIAEKWHEVHSMLFLGRGTLYPLALEGALKLKEISYIHAEGQAAGEMKHGPIALIDHNVPTVVLNPNDAHFLKVRSNLSEVRARSGPVVLVATEGDHEAHELADFVLEIPAVSPHLLPLITAVPLQLLAYTMADYKGTDIDQPRNLAKSVTVE